MSSSEDEIRRKRSRSRERSGSMSGSGSEDEKEEEYEVEEIRDKKFRDGQWIYYIKWVGWESDTNTWEPKEHLADCPEKLEEFERKWKKKQEKKERRAREEKERMMKEREEREKRREEKYEKRRLASSSSESESEERKQKQSSRPDDRPSGADRAAEEKRRAEERAKKEKKKIAMEGDGLFKVEKDGSGVPRKRNEPPKQPTAKLLKDKPDKILGATKVQGDLHFLVQYKNKDANDLGLVKAKDAYLRFPQLCLAYYESHLELTDS